MCRWRDPSGVLERPSAGSRRHDLGQRALRHHFARARQRTLRLTRALGAWLVLATPLFALAQDATEDEDVLRSMTEKLEDTRWAQSYPPRDYEGSCDVGFLAFTFRPNGFFLYNNRIAGSWRIDGLGYLRLRTRAGDMITMSIQGDTLRPLRNYSSPTMRRTDVFQRCPQE